MPFSGGAFGEYFRRVTDTSITDAQIGGLHFVSSGYLEALGARLVSGRSITDTDLERDGPRVAVSVRRRRARSSVRHRRSVNV